MALAGCEGGQSPLTDGSLPEDGRDAGDCGVQSNLTGELVDWDSSDASFAGVGGAQLTLNGDSSVSLVTPPNGRIDLCARPDLPLEFAIDNPGDFLDGPLSIERSSIGFPLSLRALTSTRAASFLAEHAVTFDPALAQIIVLQAGDRFELSLDLPHDTALAANDDDDDGALTWGAGATGRYVLFPNVQLTASTATVSGPPMIPRTFNIAAGKLSSVVLAFFLIGP